MIQIKRVIHPTDFSENSKEALEFALAICEWHKADLTLLHVCEVLEFAPPEYYMDKDEVSRQLKERIDAAKKELDRVAAGHRKPTFRIQPLVVTGKPFVEIIRVAKEQNADMIVLGTHGRTGLAHILIGSTSEKVVRKAPCPVLTVRSSTHKYVEP
jgi:nucleotide-binding universal stress UspA family protein